MIAISILRLIFFLGISFLFGDLILSFFNVTQNGSKIWRNFFWSWFLGITLPSFLLSLLNVWLQIPINQTSIFILYLSVFFLLIFKRKFLLKQVIKPDQYLFLFSVFVFSFFLMLLFRFWAKGILGGDTITYVYRSAVILDTGFSIDNYDRNIIHNLPIILSFMSGFNLIYAFKISISLLFAISALSLVALGESLYLKNPFWTLVLGLTSLPFLKMYSSLIAFSFGLTGLIVIIQLLIALKENPSKTKIWSLLIVTIGIQFSLHGLLSYSLPIFIFPIILEIFWNQRHKIFSFKKKFLLVIISTILILGIITQPSTFKWGHIFLSNVTQIINIFTPNPKRVELNPLNNLPIDMDVDSNNESTQISKSFQQLSLIKNFRENYSSLFLISGILGYLLLFLFIQKHNFRYIAYFFTVIFLLTQQNFIELNWWPTRFILAMYIPLSILSVFLLEKLSLLNKHPKTFFYGGISVLLLFQINYLKTPPELGYKLSLTPTRYEFLSNLEKLVPIDSTIFDFSTTPSWTKALNPYHDTITVNLGGLCTQTENPQQHASLAVKLQDSNLTATKAAQLFLKNSPNQEFYVVFDVLNPCLNQNLFDRDNYSVLDKSRSLRLLKYNLN